MRTIDRLRLSPSPQRGTPYPETARILSLPIREDPDKLPPEILRDLGGGELWDIQNKALECLRKNNGGVFPIGVGHGKTLISALSPTILKSKKALLLVPAPLFQKTLKEFQELREVWDILPPEIFTILSYSRLSLADSSELLEELQPDLIVADEAHLLRQKTSARTKRVIRYFQKFPATRFVGLSGTLTARSLKDYTHLIELSLREKSPVPLDYRELQAWSVCVDAVTPEPATLSDRRIFSPVYETFGAFGHLPFSQSQAREAYRRRLQTCPGVLMSRDSSFAGSLVFAPLSVAICESARRALGVLARTWTLPNGEELVDALEQSRARRQLSQGFYYTWVWEEGTTREQIAKWKGTRAQWNREVRRILSQNKPGRDSPHLIEQWEAKPPRVQALWDAWQEQRDSLPAPQTVPIWVSLSFLEEVARLFKETQTPTLFWVESVAVLEALRSRGFPTYGSGEDIPRTPASCFVSRRAHGTGENLQRFARSVVLTPPPSGAVLEQLVGRTHRPGQAEDLVEVFFILSTPEAGADLNKARGDARYVEESTGAVTKVLLGEWVDFPMTLK